MAKNRAIPIVMEVFPYSSPITGAFKVINSDGFNGSLNRLRIQNTTDVPVLISFDGQYSHEYLFASDEIDINNQSSSHRSVKKALIKKYSKVYVKSADGVAKKGAIILSGFYQEEL